MHRKHQLSILMGTLLLMIVSLSMPTAQLAANSNRTLGFAVYTTNSSFLQAYKIFYTKNTTSSILIDDDYNPITGTYRNYLSYWDTAQTFPRLLFGDSFTGITGTIVIAHRYFFTKNDLINYDAENWPSTPLAEQQNQPYWVQQACQAAHNAGYSFSYSPELGGNTGSQLTQINWTCIDYFDIQEQALSSNTRLLVANTTQMIAISKGVNPKLKVYVQIDMNAGLAQTKADIAALANVSGVDGITLTYVNSQCSASDCNPQNLVTLVDFIKATGLGYAQSNKTSMQSGLSSYGFTNITLDQNISATAPGNAFLAFDPKVGKSVIVLALPSSYNYQHLVSGKPYTYIYSNANNQSFTAEIGINNTNYYPTTTSNAIGKVQFKEFIPYVNTTISISTTSTTSTSTVTSSIPYQAPTASISTTQPTTSTTTVKPIVLYNPLNISIRNDIYANQYIIISNCTPGDTIALYYGFNMNSIVTHLFNFNYTCPSNYTINDYRHIIWWTNSGQPTYIQATDLNTNYKGPIHNQSVFIV